MSEFDHQSHELLAAMIAEGNPGALTDRGHFLHEVAPHFAEVGELIATRMANLEWRGETADAIRAWGEHFRRESMALAKYAMVISKSMVEAGQALAEARSSMPPAGPLSPLAPTTGEPSLLEQIAAEPERQEAIGVMERLASRYRAANSLLASADEPRFQPLEIRPEHVRLPSGAENGPSSSGGGPYAAPVASEAGPPPGGDAAPAGGGRATPYAPAPYAPDGPGRGGFGAASTPGVVWPADSGIGTSLDSVGPVPEVAPPVPTVSPVPSAGPHPDGQVGLATPPVPPPTGAGGGRVPPGPGGTARAVGRPAVFGTGTGTSGTDPHAAGRPAPAVVGTGGQAPTGRPPVVGMPTTGGAVPLVPGHQGVVGGIPRPAERLIRGVPRGGVVGPGAVPAVRDPATGAVRGTGGGLVGRPAGRAGETGTAGLRATGGTARRRSRREDDDRPGKDI